ncbi:MAG: hypothetical protein M3507_01145 [Actinomycetota bacterium]|jgi:hypothetical protein|nr:hypothetical protein [Actinomycetota bacterium]
MVAVLLLALLILTGLAQPALAAESNAPAATSGNVVREPASRARNLLHVFLPGTGYSPGAQAAYLDHSASLGFHTVGLSYKNSKSINSYCKDGRDADCEENVRREIIYGVNSSSLLSVSPAKSIVGRLKTELAARKSQPGWEQFVAPDGTPVWSKVVLSGHSQGAGHVAIMAQDQAVARVALLAGPNDGGKGSNTSAPWVDGGPGKTSSSSWYALGHVDDASRLRQIDAWNRLKVPSNSAKADVPTGASRLFTTLKPSDSTRGHESVVIDQYLVKTNGGVPALQPTWASLLTNGLAAA